MKCLKNQPGVADKSVGSGARLSDFTFCSATNGMNLCKLDSGPRFPHLENGDDDDDSNKNAYIIGLM